MAMLPVCAIPILCMGTWLFSAIHCGGYGIYDRWNRPDQITLDSSLTEFYFKWFALEFVLNILPVTVGYILNIIQHESSIFMEGVGGQLLVKTKLSVF